MARISQAKKLKRLEGIVIGAGFLLQQIRTRYGSQMGLGMILQVQDCLRDCNQVSRTVAERERKAQYPEVKNEPKQD